MLVNAFTSFLLGAKLDGADTQGWTPLAYAQLKGCSQSEQKMIAAEHAGAQLVNS